MDSTEVRRTCSFGGRYLCRREGIEREDAGNVSRSWKALALAERADLAARQSREGGGLGGA